MTYEDLLKRVHGRAYDIKLFVILSLNGLPNALLMCSIVMLMYSPPMQRCKLPSYVSNSLLQNSSSSDAILDFFIPKSDQNGSFSKCLIYDRSYDQFVAFWNETEKGIANKTILFSNSTTVSCEDNKVYFEPYGKQSVVMEFDWTCDRSWIKPLFSLIYLFGVMIGTLSGFLSDRFGRKPIFCIFTLLLSGATFLLTFSNSKETFLFFFFLCGLFNLVNYMAGFVLGAECTISRSRNFMSISSFITFSLGFPISSLLNYLTPSWRWSLRIIGGLGAFFVANFWLIPESPRWLLANGQVKRAKNVLTMIARYNKKEDLLEELEQNIDEEAECLLKEIENEKKSENVSRMLQSFREICSSFRMKMYFVIIFFSWFTVCLLYYAINFGVQALSGNLYVNNSLMGLVELPGLAIAYLSVKYLKRPISHGGLMALSGFLCLASALSSETNQNAASVIALFGKCANAGAFYVMFIHTVEIYPTTVRNSCTSVGSAIGRVGALISPYIVYLGDLYGIYLPYMILSILATTTGAFILFGLPETKGKMLPETVEDVLRFETLVKSCQNKVQKRKIKITSSEMLFPETNVIQANLESSTK